MNKNLALFKELVRDNKHDEIIKLANNIMSSGLKDKSLLSQLIQACFLSSIKLTRYDEAIAYFNRMKSLGLPISVIIEKSLGKILENPEQYGNFVPIIELYVEDSYFYQLTNPYDENVVVNLANYIFKFNNPDLVERFVEKTIKIPIDKRHEIYHNFAEPFFSLYMQKCPKDAKSYCLELWSNKKDFDTLKRIYKFIPEGKNRRIFFDTLLGDDPVGNAILHIKRGKDFFRKFIEGVENNDNNLINRFVTQTNWFISGAIFYFNRLSPEEIIKGSAVYLYMMPKSTELFQIIAIAHINLGKKKELISLIEKFQEIYKDNSFMMDYQLQILGSLGRFDKIEEISNKSDVNLSAEVQFKILYHSFRTSPSREIAEQIINFSTESNSASIAIKAEVLFYISKELESAEAINKFALLLKADPKNHSVFYFFGMFKNEVEKDYDKANFLFKKAYELGSTEFPVLTVMIQCFVEEKNFAEALKVSLKSSLPKMLVYTGVIYYNLGYLQNALTCLQKYLRYFPDDIRAKTVLGYCYAYLGKEHSALSVYEDLKACNIDNHCLCHITNKNSILPMSQNYKPDFMIEENPTVFLVYLDKQIQYIESFYQFGRVQSAIEIINLLMPYIDVFEARWSMFSTSMKSIADFYTLVFQITQDSDFIERAKSMFMKRIEIDKRAESFIDLARVFCISNDFKSALLILRRSIRVFYDNPSLWNALGIVFFHSKHISYARHCFSVSYKCFPAYLASVTYAAALEFFENNSEIFIDLCEKAYSLNSLDPNVLLLKAIRHEESINFARLSFDYYPNYQLAKALAIICMNSNMKKEALDYSLISQQTDLISLALELDKNYSTALSYAQDESHKTRLRLLQKDFSVTVSQESEMKAFLLYNEKKYQEAIHMYRKFDTMTSKLSIIQCYIAMNNRKSALGVFREIINHYGPDIHPKYIKMIINSIPNEIGEIRGIVNSQTTKIQSTLIQNGYIKGLINLLDLFHDENWFMKSFFVMICGLESLKNISNAIREHIEEYISTIEMKRDNIFSIALFEKFKPDSQSYLIEQLSILRPKYILTNRPVFIK